MPERYKERLGNIFTLGGGFTATPFGDTFYYLTSKARLMHLPKFDVATGIRYIRITIDAESDGFWYGVSTYSTRERSFTFGLGWGYAGKETADKPIIMFGGEVQLSNNFKILTENWFPPDADFGLISFGFRFFGEHMATDIGFFTGFNRK